MNRLRLVLLALALGVLVPAALLVRHALIGAAAERQARHRAVAEVVFDEMERRLGAVIRREEARPHGQYRATWIPDPAPGVAQAAAVSPLAAAPADPFIIGYFQFDPDGGFTQPSEAVPLDARAEVARHAAAWRPAPAVRPAPLAVEEAGRIEQQAQQSVDVFRAVGKKARAETRGAQRVEAVPAWNAKVFVDPSAAATPESGAGVEVVVDPLVGRRVAPDRLVLLRSVLVSGRTFRQGFVVDVMALHADLVESIVRGTELEGAVDVAWDAVPRDRAAEGFPHAYAHRFLDPFDTLSATLYVRELPAMDGTRTVVGLAALLLVACAVGLLAVERMAATRLAFAERRANFVASVTHELKTPLTAIRLHAEMLRDGMATTEDKRTQYLTTVTAEAERLSRLVDDVLELSQLQRGTRSISLTTSDARHVLAEAAEALAPQARRAGHEIVVDAGDTPCVARFDREALMQILVNLVDNALKYARAAGDRRIILSCRADGGRVTLGVRDHGPGVPEAQLAHVFEPFYRGERELTRSTSGTGIGLALVRGLAERMGARVSARNAEGGGLEVTIDLAG